MGDRTHCTVVVHADHEEILLKWMGRPEESWVYTGWYRRVIHAFYPEENGGGTSTIEKMSKANPEVLFHFRHGAGIEYDGCTGFYRDGDLLVEFMADNHGAPYAPLIPPGSPGATERFRIQRAQTHLFYRLLHEIYQKETVDA